MTHERDFKKWANLANQAASVAKKVRSLEMAEAGTAKTGTAEAGAEELDELHAQLAEIRTEMLQYAPASRFYWFAGRPLIDGWALQTRLAEGGAK